MFPNRKDNDDGGGKKKTGTLSRFFSRLKLSSNNASSAAPATSRHSTSFTTYAPPSAVSAARASWSAGSNARASSSVTRANAPTSQATPSNFGAPSTTEEDKTFSLTVNKNLWPEFSPGDRIMEGTGQLFIDFTDSPQRRWVKGEDTGVEFGRPIFRIKAVPVDKLPTRLFDLAQNRTIFSNTLVGEAVAYTIISHVWGEVFEIDGSAYGVDWKIPVRRKAKLDQMLMAAKIIGGLRYLWIDILCLDQRTRSESEVPKMGEYYANASGCLVWLDNAFGGPNWQRVLNAMEEVNRFFKMDKSGISTISPAQMFEEGGLANISLNGSEALAFVRKVLSIEAAPWFQRVWTLQEAVIPDSLYLCTPERYIVSGAVLFQLLSFCGMVAKVLLEVGSMAGVGVNHELQKAETWKILRLRQLYRKKRISYWHLFQATKTRTSKYEQDKVFGVSGLIHGRIPIVDYNRGIRELYLDLHKSSLETREFATCFFLGDGETPLVPDMSCLPLIISPPSEQSETHQLSLTLNGLQLDDVGIDTVTRVHPILTHGSLRTWNHLEFLDLPAEVHTDIAKAFEVSSDTVNSLTPAAFAAFAAIGPGLPPDMLKLFGREFHEKYEAAVPKGLLMWTKATFLMQASEDNAFVVLWTASSVPQLGVVMERVQGNVCVVTPSSYAQNAGEGCLICKVNPNGTLKKIGLGMGRQVKASRKVSTLLV